MKQPNGSRVQPVFGRPAQRFANVAKHHIAAAYCVGAAAKCLCDRLFHQTFFRTDAKVTGEDFDDVLDIRSAGPRKSVLQ